MDKIVKYIVIAVLFIVCVPGILFKLPYSPWSHAIVFTVAWYVVTTLHPVLEGLNTVANQIANLEKRRSDKSLRPNQRAKLVKDLANLRAKQPK